MKKEELKKLSKEELTKKKDSLKTFVGVYIALIVALSFFVIRNYVLKGEVDWAPAIITLCTVGGFFAVYQQLQQVQEEWRERE